MALVYAESKGPSHALLSKIQMGYVEDLWFSVPSNLANLTLDKQGLYRLGQKKPSARIVIPNIASIKFAILKEMHDSVAAGHPGPRLTMDLLSRYFGWKGMSDFFFYYVLSFESC